MSNDLPILLLASSINILIALLILIRNPKQAPNIAFALTCFSLVAWGALNYASSHIGSDYTLIVTRSTGLFGVLLIMSFYILSTVFPTTLNIKRRTIYLMTALSLTACIHSLSPLSVSDAFLTDDGLQITEGVLYSLYTLFIVCFFILCNINFIKQFRTAGRLAKSQIKFMWIGLITTFALIILFNMLIPALTDSWSSSRLGTLSTIPFVAITGYAIAKQRMFDVRLIITRTIAYTLTIGIVAALYTVTVILIATYFTPFEDLGFAQILTLVFPAVFAALTFHSVQRYIDKLTTKVFYRDSYDTREVLDRLSGALMSTNNIDKLLQNSGRILGSAIHSKTFYSIVFDESLNKYKDYPKKQIELEVTEKILSRLHRHAGIIIEKDTIISKDSKLYEIMQKNGIEIILRLGSKKQPSALILVGLKNNGGIYSKQDVQLLEISAKNLVVALDNAFKYEQILHFADTMHREVNRATSRLRKANQKLKTVDALKDEFIATASHQLRTPAASVHDALKLLNHPAMTNKERHELINLAEASSEHLVTVVRTMLNMARLQAGHFTIDRSTVDLVELTTNVVDQIKIIADQKNTKIQLIKPKYAMFYDVDVAKITEAISNYTENAIKYSPPNSTITVSIAENNSRIVFEVADQGIGVPMSEQKNLFGKFYRASNARQEEPDGNGIGLYVVRSIAEGHGGEAYYRPSDKGGSVFGIWIPAD